MFLTDAWLPDDFFHAVLRVLVVVDAAVVVGSLIAGKFEAVLDQAEEQGVSKALPPVVVDMSGEAASAHFVGAGRVEVDAHAGRCL